MVWIRIEASLHRQLPLNDFIVSRLAMEAGEITQFFTTDCTSIVAYSFYFLDWFKSLFSLIWLQCQQRRSQWGRPNRAYQQSTWPVRSKASTLSPISNWFKRTGHMAAGTVSLISIATTRQSTIHFLLKLIKTINTPYLLDFLWHRVLLNGCVYVGYLQLEKS